MARSGLRVPGTLILGAACLVAALNLAPIAGQDLKAASTRPVEEIQRSIREARRAGRYDEAADSARVLTDRLRSDPSAKAWEIAAADELLRTMTQIAQLDAESQAALAQADRLDADLRECEKRGDWAAGVTFARQQLALREQHLGGSHPEVARSLSDLSTYLFLEGQLAEAETTARRALQMGLEQLHPDSPSLAGRYAALGRILVKRGDYSGAETCLKEELAVHRRAYPEGNRRVAMSTNNLAILYLELGDFTRAEVYFAEAISAYRQRVRTPDAQLAKMLLNQGLVHRAQGDFEAALSSLRGALAIRRQILDAANPEIANTLAELAQTYRETGALDSSLALCKEALTLRQRLLPVDHPDVVESWRILGEARAAQGDQAGADSAYAVALASAERIWPGGHPTIARLFHAQARVQMAQDRHAQALPLLEQALDMMRTWTGYLHPDVSVILSDIGVCLLAEGKPREAEQRFVEAAHVFESTRLRAGLGYERATFQESPYWLLAATRLRLGEMQEAWTATESAHARALVDLLRKNTPAARSPDERTKERRLQDTIALHEAQLESLRTAAGEPGAPGRESDIERAYTALLRSQSELEDFTRQMAEQYPLIEGQPFPLARVRRALGEDEALVGWLCAQRTDSLTDAWGYVVRRTGPVRWVRLAEGEPPSRTPEVTGILDRYREALALAARFGPTRASNALCTNLAQRIWQRWVSPMETSLAGVRRLSVIPSGPMQDIPIEALIDPAGRYACDRYSISYTPSATVLAFLREQPGARRPPGQWQALLVGDPPFNAEQLRQMDSRPGGPDSCGAAGRGGSFQPAATYLSRALAGDAIELDSLPRLCASRAEIDSIARTIPLSTILLGPAASEQKLAGLGNLSDFDVIHLATHALIDDGRPGRSALILSRIGLPAPLDAVTPCGEILDGRLTADEICSCLSLDAELVTLSGCQTALGRPTAGEGHIGLAHAFLQAGARNLVVSLWRVEDAAAAVFMRSFYRNLLHEAAARAASGQDDTGLISRALQRARQDVRAYGNEFGERPYTHPVYWAGFVLVGAGS